MAKKNDYLCYDWKIGDRGALFAVNLDLYANAPDSFRNTLIFVCIENKKKSALSGAERRKIDFFEADCEKKFDLQFAGFIDIPEARQYYAYINESEYPKIYKYAKRGKHFKIRIGKKYDPAWKVYFKTLYPNAAKYQTVLNAPQLQTLYANGDSEAPRRINLHMFFKNEPLMLQYAEDARNDGFAIGDTEIRYENKLPYGIVVRRVCALTKKDVDALTVRGIRLAERYHGKLLFWDCPIAPKDQM